MSRFTQLANKAMVKQAFKQKLSIFMQADRERAKLQKIAAYQTIHSMLKQAAGAVPTTNINMPKKPVSKQPSMPSGKKWKMKNGATFYSDGDPVNEAFTIQGKPGRYKLRLCANNTYEMVQA